MVEIAKALAKNAKLMILDEPTSSLNEEDSQALLDLLLEFKKQGMTSIIISHKINEVSYVADDITILRDGHTIETLTKGVDDLSEERIIRGMVGRKMEDRFPKRSGVNIGEEEGDIVRADEVSYVNDDKTQVGIEIHSGRNRVVRRMFDALGYRVTKLDRVQFAGLTKKRLRRGDWRFLTEKEVNMLRMGAYE
jgi:pseudouridine synthase